MNKRKLLGHLILILLILNIAYVTATIIFTITKPFLAELQFTQLQISALQFYFNETTELYDYVNVTITGSGSGTFTVELYDNGTTISSGSASLTGAGEYQVFLTWQTGYNVTHVSSGKMKIE